MTCTVDSDATPITSCDQTRTVAASFDQSVTVTVNGDSIQIACDGSAWNWVVNSSRSVRNLSIVASATRALVTARKASVVAIGPSRIKVPSDDTQPTAAARAPAAVST